MSAFHPSPTLPSSTPLADLWSFGLLCRRKSNHPSAINTFQQCLTIAADSPEPWEKLHACMFNLASEHSDVGSYAAGISVCQQLLVSVHLNAPTSTDTVDTLISTVTLHDTRIRLDLPVPLPAIVQATHSLLAALKLKIDPPGYEDALYHVARSLVMQERGRGEAVDYFNFNLVGRGVGRQEGVVEGTWELINEAIGGEKIETVALPVALPVALSVALPDCGGESEVVNVVCVKYGTKYDANYVNQLYEGVRRHLVRKFVFHCFTDDAEGIAEGIVTHELEGFKGRGVAGWWGKVRVFGDRSIVGRCMYIDLDSVITGSLDDILDKCGGKPFVTLGTEGMINERRVGGLNTSFMVWSQGVDDGTNPFYMEGVCSELVRSFRTITRFIYKLDHWFEMMVPNATRLQDICEAGVAEYRQLKESGMDVEGVGIVTFPLKPKPHECVGEEWMKGRWDHAL